jgi:pimeloyl-ACP methyl ester carboxylesterase
VIAPDLRGHGESDKPLDSQKYGIELVNDVVRLLDHLHIEKAHVVGYSMGGLILAKLLVDHPERVKSAVIGGAGGIQNDFDFRFVNAVCASMEEGVPTGDALIMHWDLTRDVALSAEMQENFRALNRLNGVAFAKVARSWQMLEVSADQLSQIQVPTLVVYGEKETYMTLPAAPRLAKLVPNCERVVVPGATHSSTPLSPDYTRAIVQFLAKYQGSK